MTMERDKAFNSTDAPFFRVFRSSIRTFTIVRDAHCSECIPCRRVTVIGETLITLKMNALMPYVRLDWQIYLAFQNKSPNKFVIFWQEQ